MNQKIAVVQDAPVAYDLDATLARAEDWMTRARDQSVDLVVFPEVFIGGYPKGADFGARVGSRSEQGRAQFARYLQQAIELPGPEIQRLADHAHHCDLDVVVGVLERAGATLYCSAAIIHRENGLQGIHRKLMPTAMERLIWGFGDGSTLPVVNTRCGRVGAAICWENYMPMLRMSLYQQGIEMWCAPTVDDRDSWIPSMQHIATEGRCFVLSACQFARRKDCPTETEGEPEDVLIRGGSVIVDPFGSVLAGPEYGRRCMLTAEVDRQRIIEGKFDLDVAGHYARPDVFSLTVDSRPKPAAAFADINAWNENEED